jgi:NitT/TauT family transport system substrate-binding protein/sulfonate transport system substrate-binding protein
MVLRVGVHPNNLHLTLAQHWKKAPSDRAIAFVPYPEGRDTGQWLTEGRIDIGGTGSTPPIISQVSGLDVLYVAASAPRPANGAILTAAATSIVTVLDLRGKRIALLDGSFHTYLLARVLERDGLTLKDIERVELQPAPSQRALEDGRVDAWIAMAPHLDQALASKRFRELVTCGSNIPNRSVFWTIGSRGLSRDQIQLFVSYLADIGREISGNVDKAAAILSDLKIGNVDYAVWRKALAARDWTIVPVSADVIAEQQDEADTLFRHHELSRSIKVRAALPRATAAA